MFPSKSGEKVSGEIVERKMTALGIFTGILAVSRGAIFDSWLEDGQVSRCFN